MIENEAAPTNNIESLNRLQAWRERVIRIILILIPFVGAGILFLNAKTLIDAGMWTFLAIFVIAFVTVTAISIFRNRLPYNIRVIGILGVVLGVAPLSYSIYGLQGDGRIWLMFFIVFTVLMLGMRAGVVATVIATPLHLVLGYLFTAGYLPTPPPETIQHSLLFEGWITTGITLLFLSVVLFISVGLVVRSLDDSISNLETTLTSERQLLRELESEQYQLRSRSADLERRVGQIRLAAEISRSLGTILEPKELMDYLANRVKEGFDLYYVGVFQLDERKRYAVLTIGTGEPGRKMVADSHQLSVGGSSMVGWATANRQPRIALDVGREAIRFRNPHLPDTRSELALPLMIGNDVHGALTVQSTEPDAFDQDDIIVLQSIADSFAIALQNAELFQQIEDSLQEIQHLNRQYLGEAWRDISQEEQGLSYSVESSSAEEELSAANLIDIPLTLRGDQVIGKITLEAQREDWSPDELEFLEAVSNQAALALESARLLEETQRRVEREQTLNRMTTQLAQTLDFESLIQAIVRELGNLPSVTEAAIHIAPPTNSQEKQPLSSVE
ncbi:GAF domain-containing protein [Chloroflexota bacterium]